MKKKNLEIKNSLCEKAEVLIDEPNVVEAFKRLQKLHEEWRELGPVPKELREEIWERFKKATSNINKRQQEFFERLKGPKGQKVCRTGLSHLNYIIRGHSPDDFQ